MQVVFAIKRLRTDKNCPAENPLPNHEKWAAFRMGLVFYCWTSTKRERFHSGGKFNPWRNKISSNSTRKTWSKSLFEKLYQRWRPPNSTHPFSLAIVRFRSQRCTAFEHALISFPEFSITPPWTFDQMRDCWPHHLRLPRSCVADHDPRYLTDLHNWMLCASPPLQRRSFLGETRCSQDVETSDPTYSCHSQGLNEKVF